MNRSWHVTAAFLCALVLTFVTPRTSLAQRNVACNSTDDRYHYCPASNFGDVELLTQYSQTRCILGLTWGYDERGIWVDRGCRATFRLTSGSANFSRGRRVDCASVNERYHECEVYTGGHVTVARQISRNPCIEGRTWGFQNGHIWVDSGCRAEFEVLGRSAYDEPHMSTWHSDDGQYIRCESRDEAYARCRVNIHGQVSLSRRISSASCVEGRSWGYDDNGIWVDNGCRGEFLVERSGGNPYRLYSSRGGERIVRCESFENRRDTCFVGSGHRVSMVNRLSSATCVEGRTWGYSGSQIWVSAGCRAEFRVN